MVPNPESGPRYRLSAFIRFIPCIGENRLNNQNIADGSDRLEFLDGLIAHLNMLFEEGRSRETVFEFLQQVPFWRQLVTLDDTDPARPRVHAATGMRSFLHF